MSVYSHVGDVSIPNAPVGDEGIRLGAARPAAFACASDNAGTDLVRLGVASGCAVAAGFTPFAATRISDSSSVSWNFDSVV